MGSRKLVRDLYLSKQPLLLHLLSSQQASSARLRLISPNGCSGYRGFSVFNEFSNKIKGEVNRNSEFQQTVKELKEKAEELKGVKEELKVRTKQTTEQLYRHVDGVWTEAEATAKKVSANVKEKISAATEDSGPSDTAETLFGKFKSSVSTVSPKVSLAFEKLKEAKDELSSNPSKRKQMQRAASSASPGERSTKQTSLLYPQSNLDGVKMEALKDKMQGHPVFKRISGLSEPVVTKGQELAEDVRERWETSDNPVVHKIQDLNESVFGETAAAMSFKEIRRRDPYDDMSFIFSLPDFVSEVQEKYCSPEVIERCKAEHGILHISDVEVRETKMMGTSPIIIVAFQTQQVYCVRSADGSIKEGARIQSTLCTMHGPCNKWMQRNLGRAIYPIWRLREMQQLGVQALI
ncbi:hypothetical protein AAG906_040711 [Vitis piasezkii]